MMTNADYRIGDARKLVIKALAPLFEAIPTDAQVSRVSLLRANERGFGEWRP